MNKGCCAKPSVAGGRPHSPVPVYTDHPSLRSNSPLVDPPPNLVLRGHASQPGPRAEDRERCQGDRDPTECCHRVPMSAMPGRAGSSLVTVALRVSARHRLGRAQAGASVGLAASGE